MAENRLTASERAEIQRLVRGLYDGWQPAEGRKTWAAFARHVGVSEYSLQEWRTGRGAPSAINLIRLLRAGASVQPMSAEDDVGGQQVRSVEPIGLMREALENQAEMKRRWELFERRLQALVDGQEKIADGIADLVLRLERLADEQSQRRASP